MKKILSFVSKQDKPKKELPDTSEIDLKMTKIKEKESKIYDLYQHQCAKLDIDSLIHYTSPDIQLDNENIINLLP